MSLTIAGIGTLVLGTIFVNYFGISNACSSELTAKVVEYAPMAIGSIMAYIGRYRLGGINILGGRV